MSLDGDYGGGGGGGGGGYRPQTTLTGTGPRFNRPVEFDPELIVAVAKSPSTLAEQRRQKADFGFESDHEEDHSDDGGDGHHNGSGSGAARSARGGGHHKTEEVMDPDHVKVSRTELDKINRAMQEAAAARQSSDAAARKAEERAARTEQIARSTQAMLMKKHAATVASLNDTIDEQKQRLGDDDELLETLYAKLKVLEPVAAASQPAALAEQYKTAEKAHGGAITRARELDRDVSEWKRRSHDLDLQCKSLRDELSAKETAIAAGLMTPTKPGLATPASTPAPATAAAAQEKTPAPAAAASAPASTAASSAAVDKLNAELSQRVRDIDALTTTINTLKQQLSSATASNAQYATAVQTAQAAQASAQAQVTALTAAANSSGQSNSANAAAAAATAAAHAQALAAANAATQQSRTQLDGATRANTELETKLKAASTALAALQTEKASIEATLASVNGQLKQLTIERIKSEEHITGLNAQIKQLQSGHSTSSAEMADQLSTLNTKLRAIESERATANIALAALQTKHTAAETAAATKTAELNREIAAAQTKLATANQAITVLQSDKTAVDASLATATATVRELQADKIRAEERITGLTNQLKAIESGSSASTAELNEQIVQLKTKSRTLELERTTAAENVARLEAALKSSNDNAANQATAASTAAAASATATAAVQAELDAKRVELKAAEAKDAEVVKERAHLEEMTRQLNDVLKKREEELKTLRAKAKTKLDLAATTVTKLKTEYTNLRTLYTNEKKQLSDRVTELETEKVATLTAHTAAMDGERKTGADKLKAEIDRLRADSEKTIAESERMRKETESSAKQKIEQLRSDGLKLKGMAQRMQARLQLLNTALATRKQTLARLIPVTKALQEQVTTLKSTVTAQVAGMIPALTPVIGDAVRAQLDKHVGAVMTKYRAEVKLRKSLHNQLLELKGNIRVFCRVRGLNAEETKSGKMAIKFPEDDTIGVRDEKRNANYSFEFDKVFQPTVTQEGVFTEVGPLIQSVLDGYNVCIFAYGQTGSGKTYTMEGPPTSRGVNYRALDLLFSAAPAQSETTYEFDVSLLEIYNEKIFDLLGDNAATASGLKAVKGESGQMEVQGLHMQRVSTSTEVVAVMKQGMTFRSTTATDSNAASSRSHLILSVYVSATNVASKKKTRSKLHLIDLAGSERVAKSGVSGDAMKEAQAINTSLSALGMVIAARANKAAHVPYRDSTLTYLLQDSLEKNSKTLMIVQVAPTEDDVSESISSLKFATGVRKVELGPVSKNKASSSASPATPTTKLASKK